MRMRKLSALAFTAALVMGSAGTGGGAAVSGKAGGGGPVAGAGAPARQAAEAVYKLDAARSKFMVRAFAGGLLWFKGHDHFVAARDFTGEARLTPGSVSPASLTLTVRAASLAETRDVFTEPQKKIINGELRDIVLEPDKYPEITFRSTDVTVEVAKGGSYNVDVVYKVKLGGDLTLHGVTRHVVIPAEVTLDGQDLRARGEFEVKRSDYKVPATSAFHGTVRVRDRLKVSFDIVARRG
jgi:polyisoprenoid-binding protein YceI